MPRNSPASISPIRVASSSASPMSCVTITIVLPQPLLQFVKLPPHLAAGQRIERPKRLIHQQNGRIGGQRPRHAHALSLPSGKLVRIAPQKFAGLESHQGQQLLARASAGGARTSPRAAARRAIFFSTV